MAIKVMCNMAIGSVESFIWNPSFPFLEFQWYSVPTYSLLLLVSCKQYYRFWRSPFTAPFNVFYSISCLFYCKYSSIINYRFPVMSSTTLKPDKLLRAEAKTLIFICPTLSPCWRCFWGYWRSFVLLFPLNLPALYMRGIFRVQVNSFCSPKKLRGRYP